MIKFIRTKDRINLLRKDGDKYIVKDSDYTCEITVDEETLLKNYKVADTIGELCDEFVLYDELLKNYGVFDKRVITYEWLKNHIDIYKEIPIYGCIWTDKGLIYVAKMNDKGDLELI